MNKKFIYILLFTLSFIYISCKSENNTDGEVQLSGSKDTVVYGTDLTPNDSAAMFLIRAAAEDFLNTKPPLPLDFRNVRLKLLSGSGTIERYIICGQFLAKDEKGHQEWIDFTTIKTDPYEQWLGSVASEYCTKGKPVSNKRDDLSPLLKSRLQELQSSGK